MGAIVQCAGGGSPAADAPYAQWDALRGYNRLCRAGGPDPLLFLEPRVITENTLRRGFAPPEDLLQDT